MAEEVDENNTFCHFAKFVLIKMTYFLDYCFQNVLPLHPKSNKVLMIKR